MKQSSLDAQTIRHASAWPSSDETNANRTSRYIAFSKDDVNTNQLSFATQRHVVPQPSSKMCDYF
ncbi:2934_t:CDS:2 [Entrophospora sp. SA101]|nr:18897_t:CDS:2 [Entrophospora sp. SA101]CAJ0756746.1 2934_t:CDS:2 [Entrophospora sp. SA101]